MNTLVADSQPTAEMESTVAASELWPRSASKNRQSLNWLRRNFNLIWVCLSGGLLVLFLLVPLLAIFGWVLFSPKTSGYLANSEVLDALTLSLITTAATLLIAVVLGTPLAYLLARHKFPGSGLLDTLLDLPLVLPPAVAGVALLITFGRFGLFGSWLDSLGIRLIATSAAVVMAQLFVAAPFYIKAAKTGFEAVDANLIAVSATLGVSYFKTFWRITIPLSLPALLSGAVMTWARALGEFGATIMFAGSLQGHTRTLPLEIYYIFENDLDAALVVSAILVVFSFTVLLLFKLLTNFGSKQLGK